MFFFASKTTFGSVYFRETTFGLVDLRSVPVHQYPFVSDDHPYTLEPKVRASYVPFPLHLLTSYPFGVRTYALRLRRRPLPQCPFAFGNRRQAQLRSPLEPKVRGKGERRSRSKGGKGKPKVSRLCVPLYPLPLRLRRRTEGA